MKFEAITGRIIGCAMKVHTTLGNGFFEIIYQRALQIEFAAEKIPFTSEMEMKIFYMDVNIGTRRVDFFVDNSIMVEIKAITALEDVHLAQALNYLEVSKSGIGRLINFGAKSLQYKRLYNNKR